MIGIKSHERNGQVISEASVGEVVLFFGFIESEFLSALHDLEDQFLILAAGLAV